MDKFRKKGRSSYSERNENCLKGEAKRTKSKSPSKSNSEKTIKGSEVTGKEKIIKGSEVTGKEKVIKGSEVTGKEKIIKGSEVTGKEKIIKGSEVTRKEKIIKGSEVTGKEKIVKGSEVTGKEIIKGSEVTGKEKIIKGSEVTGKEKIIKGSEVTGKEKIIKGSEVTGKEKIIKGSEVTGKEKIIKGSEVTGKEKIIKGSEVTGKASVVVEKEGEVDGFIDSKIGTRNENLNEESVIKDRRIKCSYDDKRISKITKTSDSGVPIVQRINTSGEEEGLDLAEQKMERDDKVFDGSEQGMDDESVLDREEENSENENIGDTSDARFKKEETSRTSKRKYEVESANTVKKRKNVVSEDSRMVLRPQKEAPNQRSKRKRKGPVKFKNSGNSNAEASIVKEKISLKEQKVKEHFSPHKRLLEKVSKDDVPSPFRSDFEATESESDDSHQEDFPTEGLLEELHFLNASCEKPSLLKTQASQSYKTPKKLKKLEIRGSEACRSSTPIDKSKKINLMKKFRDESEDQWSSKKVEEVGSIVSETTLQARSEDDCSEDSDEGSLQIVADEENPKKRKAYQGEQRKKIHLDPEGVPQEVIELIQSGIDEVLEEKAERTHLTAIHVKNIIKIFRDSNILHVILGMQLIITVMPSPSQGSILHSILEISFLL